jgi:hypothetical protein
MLHWAPRCRSGTRNRSTSGLRMVGVAPRRVPTAVPRADEMAMRGLLCSRGCCRRVIWHPWAEIVKPLTECVERLAGRVVHEVTRLQVMNRDGRRAAPARLRSRSGCVTRDGT